MHLAASLVQPSLTGAALSGQGLTGIESRPSAGNGLVMSNSGPCCPCAGSPRSDTPWAALTRHCAGQAHGCTSCTPATQKSWEQNPGHGVCTADKQLGSEATGEAEMTFKTALGHSTERHRHSPKSRKHIPIAALAVPLCVDLTPHLNCSYLLFLHQPKGITSSPLRDEGLLINIYT